MKLDEVLVMQAQLKTTGANIHDVNSEILTLKWAVENVNNPKTTAERRVQCRTDYQKAHRRLEKFVVSGKYVKGT